MPDCLSSGITNFEFYPCSSPHSYSRPSSACHQRFHTASLFTAATELWYLQSLCLQQEIHQRGGSSLAEGGGVCGVGRGG